MTEISETYLNLTKSYYVTTLTIVIDTHPNTPMGEPLILIS